MTTPEELGFRPQVPYVADERTLLESYLDYHRGTLLWKIDGLSGEQLAQATVEPSGLTLLGLIRHMADNERWWFRRNAAQLDLGDIYFTEEQPDRDFEDLDPARAEADVATYKAEVEAAREAVKPLTLDDTFPHPDPKKADIVMSVRWVYLHMIEEYARHNGHADLLRERTDGATGE
jgi:uncharacterized damage-inducible protein DinB